MFVIVDFRYSKHQPAAYSLSLFAPLTIVLTEVGSGGPPHRHWVYLYVYGPPPLKFECVSQICAILGYFNVVFDT